MKNILKLIIIAMLMMPTMNVLAQPPMPTKSNILNLTVFLQGFYNSTNGNMNKAQDIGLDKFISTIADTITVELHDSANYSTVIYTAYGISLNQDGTATVRVPKIYNGSYYVTVKHRNSIETTTTTAISFVDATINYNFTDAANKAYSNNLVQLAPGIYGIYSGDLNGDGLVNLDDLSSVNFALLQLAEGYNINDVNGDGLVNLDDLSAVNFALLQLIERKIP